MQPKEQEIAYWARPECGSDDRFGPCLGPFKSFLQLTYDSLRVGEDGVEVAGLDEDGLWDVIGSKEKWSDLVIWAEPLKPGEKYIGDQDTLVCVAALEAAVAGLWAAHAEAEQTRKAALR